MAPVAASPRGAAWLDADADHIPRPEAGTVWADTDDVEQSVLGGDNDAMCGFAAGESTIALRFRRGRWSTRGGDPARPALLADGGPSTADASRKAGR